MNIDINIKIKGNNINVIVKSKGDLVILIMADTEMTTEEEAIAPKLEANFDNL